MIWTTYLNLALSSIRRNPMRSILTMLGIIIGVGSVILLVSLGKGSQKEIEEQVKGLGTNMLIVFSASGRTGGVRGGAGSLQSLDINDVEALKAQAQNLIAISPSIPVQAQVIAGRINWNTTVDGVSQQMPEIQNHILSMGRFFTEREDKTKARVAVLGSRVNEELFQGEDSTGQRIRIRNQPFTVIGVLEEKGQTGMGADKDDRIFIPARTALFRLGDGKSVRVIFASATNEDTMEEAKEEVRQILRRTHRLSEGREDDFTIRLQTEIMAMAGKVTGTLTALLTAVAGVSLIVGGIGVMNIMLVTVTERTREIGLRLALGARPRDILLQFLTEAVVLTFLGGVIGIVFGLITAFGLAHILGSKAYIEINIILIALLFTAGTGIFFGFWPARKAAKLHPIEALRYE